MRMKMMDGVTLKVLCDRLDRLASLWWTYAERLKKGAKKARARKDIAIAKVLEARARTHRKDAKQLAAAVLAPQPKSRKSSKS